MALRMPVAKCNKWACLAGAGLLGATSYGITEISHASTLNSQTLRSKEYIDLRTNNRDSSPYFFNDGSFPMSSLFFEESDMDEDFDEDGNSQYSEQIVAQDPEIVTNPTADIAYSDYTVDSNYLNNLWSNSMGWKFKEHVILAPKNAKIWDYKAQKIKERAMAGWFGDKSRGLWRYKNWLYNAWNRESIDMNTMDGYKIHSLCTDILSYNDYGIWFTEISRLNYKWFFDFTWEVCGREDKPKPNNWRYATQ